MSDEDVGTGMEEETTTKKKRKKPAKPDSFKEFESLAKQIIQSNGGSYYEWLHEKHQEIILNFSVSNRKQISKIVGEGE